MTTAEELRICPRLARLVEDTLKHSDVKEGSIVLTDGRTITFGGKQVFTLAPADEKDEGH